MLYWTMSCTSSAMAPAKVIDRKARWGVKYSNRSLQCRANLTAASWALKSSLCKNCNLISGVISSISTKLHNRPEFAVAAVVLARHQGRVSTTQMLPLAAHELPATCVRLPVSKKHLAYGSAPHKYSHLSTKKKVMDPRRTIPQLRR